MHEILQYTYNYTVYFIHLFLNTLFPVSVDIQELETYTSETFYGKAHKPLENPPYNIISLFWYKDKIVQKALWELKYRGNRKIAHLFAGVLYEEILDTLSDDILFSHFNNPIIIPLPLSRERLKERGWNQSEMIVRALQAKITSKNAFFTIDTKNLQKIKHTLPQTHLSRKKRLENLKNCFAVRHPEYIKNKNIILIDDVTTTGSTIKEAMDTLYRAGARDIKAFTIAH